MGSAQGKPGVGSGTVILATAALCSQGHPEYSLGISGTSEIVSALCPGSLRAGLRNGVPLYTAMSILWSVGEVVQREIALLAW